MDGECWKRIEAAARVKKRREKVGRRGGGDSSGRGNSILTAACGEIKGRRGKSKKKGKKKKGKKKIPVSSLTGDCIRSMKDPMKDESSPS